MTVDLPSSSAASGRWDAAHPMAEPWGVTLDKVTVGWRGTHRQHYAALDIPFPALRGRLPILGRTGAGKSTLLYLLSALKWPETGRVTWRFPDAPGERIGWAADQRRNHRAIARWHALRRIRFGFCFQDGRLVPYLTVLENLKAPLCRSGLSPDEAWHEAQSLLASVLIPGEQVSTLGNRFPASLSGGQRQRVALGVAMAGEPDVIFADEPTGNLDEKTRREVMDRVLSWVDSGQGRRALVWVTHHRDDPGRYGAPRYLYLDLASDSDAAGAPEQIERWRDA